VRSAEISSCLRVGCDHGGVVGRRDQWMGDEEPDPGLCCLDLLPGEEICFCRWPVVLSAHSPSQPHHLPQNNKTITGKKDLQFSNSNFNPPLPSKFPQHL
jgi:hypothetical protein